MIERFISQAEDLSAEADDCADLIAGAETEAAKIELAARWILQQFDAYYFESRHIPEVAKEAFERRDPGTSLALSKRRLSIYGTSIGGLSARIKEVFPSIADDESFWRKVEARYLPLIEGRYEADLAFAYIHSVRRKIYQGEWKPVEYAFGEPGDQLSEKAAGETLAAEDDGSADVYRSFPGGARLTPETVVGILELPNFLTPYRDLAGDAALIAERVNRVLKADGETPDAIRTIQMIKAGFYRNRGAYLVGRIRQGNGILVPLIIALLNEPGGIYVDAVLTTESHSHNIFSSTLANFHATDSRYHGLSVFLHSIMPKRPLGLHYSTIGFNHVGKVAVMNEIRDLPEATGEVFKTAIGFRGTVAIGFAAPSSAYALKVIRDKPTSQYKWGKFEGIEAVLRKYGRVHEINRTGSMLDNIIYNNLKFERKWFDSALLSELLREASQTVFLQGSSVILKNLIVQRRMIPMPVFLETASRVESEIAIINLGHCIKNNAAANIFNKDLDARNYGVSRFLKVYLFDYDALEPFTEVKIRSNRDRIDGEEDLPDWYYENGVVFLPEEIESGLRIPSRSLRRLFRDVHGDLLTPEYWERIQQDLLDGRVPSIRTYPEDLELRQ